MQSLILNWCRSLKKKREAKRAAQIEHAIAYLTERYENRDTNKGDAHMVGLIIYNRVGGAMKRYTSEEEKTTAEIIIKKLAKKIKITNDDDVFHAIIRAEL